MSTNQKLQRIRDILANPKLGPVGKIKSITIIAGRTRGAYKKKGEKITDFVEYNRQRYMSLKAEGICTQCGESKARAGRVMCSPCAKKHRALAVARYQSQSTPHAP